MTKTLPVALALALALALAALPQVALAHPGHIAPLAGHSHPLPLIGLIAAGLIAAALLALIARDRA